MGIDYDHIFIDRGVVCEVLVKENVLMCRYENVKIFFDTSFSFS